MPDPRPDLKEIVSTLIDPEIPYTQKENLVLDLNSNDASAAVKLFREALLTIQKDYTFPQQGDTSLPSGSFQPNLNDRLRLAIFLLDPKTRTVFLDWLTDAAEQAVKQGDYASAEFFAGVLSEATYGYGTENGLGNSVARQKKLQGMLNLSIFPTSDNNKKFCQRQLDPTAAKNEKLELKVSKDLRAISFIDRTFNLNRKFRTDENQTQFVPLELYVDKYVSGEKQNCSTTPIMYSASKGVLEKAQNFRLAQGSDNALIRDIDSFSRCDVKDFDKALSKEIENQLAQLRTVKAEKPLTDADQKKQHKQIQLIEKNVQDLFLAKNYYAVHLGNGVDAPTAAQKAMFEGIRFRGEPPAIDARAAHLNKIKIEKPADQLLMFISKNMPIENKADFLGKLQDEISKRKDSITGFESTRENDIQRAGVLAAEIDTLQKQLTSELQKKNPDRDQENSLKSKLNELTLEYKVIENKFATADFIVNAEKLSRTLEHAPESMFQTSLESTLPAAYKESTQSNLDSLPKCARIEAAAAHDSKTAQNFFDKQFYPMVCKVVENKQASIDNPAAQSLIATHGAPVNQDMLFELKTEAVKPANLKNKRVYQTEKETHVQKTQDILQREAAAQTDVSSMADALLLTVDSSAAPTASPIAALAPTTLSGPPSNVITMIPMNAISSRADEFDKIDSFQDYLDLKDKSPERAKLFLDTYSSGDEGLSTEKVGGIITAAVAEQMEMIMDGMEMNTAPDDLRALSEAHEIRLQNEYKSAVNHATALPIQNDAKALINDVFVEVEKEFKTDLDTIHDLISAMPHDELSKGLRETIENNPNLDDKALSQKIAQGFVDGKYPDELRVKMLDRANDFYSKTPAIATTDKAADYHKKIEADIAMLSDPKKWLADNSTPAVSSTSRVSQMAKSN